MRMGWKSSLFQKYWTLEVQCKGKSVQILIVYIVIKTIGFFHLNLELSYILGLVMQVLSFDIADWVWCARSGGRIM